MKISILIDNPNSWFMNYFDEFRNLIKKYDEMPLFINNYKEIEKGDILFILSCNNIIPKKYLKLNNNNIVIHGSDLPKGRGWSPWTWEIEKGEDIITLTLFEANEQINGGDYYLKNKIKLEGTELITEIREKISQQLIIITTTYLEKYLMKKIKQLGKPTYYRKRSNTFPPSKDGGF